MTKDSGTIETAKAMKSQNERLKGQVTRRVPGSCQALKAKAPNTQGLEAVTLSGADCC
jgi:hypothetical protein